MFGQQTHLMVNDQAVERCPENGTVQAGDGEAVTSQQIAIHHAVQVVGFLGKGCFHKGAELLRFVIHFKQHHGNR